MELTKVFLVAEVDNCGELRQVALNKEQTEILTHMLKGGVFCKEIKLMPDVVAEVKKGDKDV